MIDPNITAFFNEIYDSTHQMVLIYLTGKCHELSDVNDICQDVYFEFYKILSGKGISYIRNPQGLLKRLARRKMHQFYQAKDKSGEIKTVSLEETEGEAVMLNPQPSPVEMPDTSEEEILIEDIYQFLKQKPDDIQKIFYLHFELEQTTAQIAKKLSMKESTVKSKLYRTREELRRRYQKEDADEERR